MKRFLVIAFVLAMFLCIGSACLASGFEQYEASNANHFVPDTQEKKKDAYYTWGTDLLNVVYVQSPFIMESPRGGDINPLPSAARITGICACNDMYKEKISEDDSSSTNSSSDIINDDTLYYVISRKGNLVQTRCRFGDQLHDDTETLNALGYQFEWQISDSFENDTFGGPFTDMLCSGTSSEED